MDKWDAYSLIEEVIQETQVYDADDNIIQDEIDKVKKLERVLKFIEKIEE
jgi:predicted AAA+ superfamily ATPase